MSSTIDVNILLYASHTASPQHRSAKRFLNRWTSGPELIYLFWPTLMSYLRMATHPSIFENPLDPRTATANVEMLIQLPYARTPGEAERFWDIWRSTTETVPVRGNLVPDAHVVALMREHGIDTIWTRDRDFRKFDGIRVRNPFA